MPYSIDGGGTRKIPDTTKCIQLVLSATSLGVGTALYRGKSVTLKEVANMATNSSGSKWHLIVMGGDIGGAWREPVEVKNLPVDFVLGQNLKFSFQTQIIYLLSFLDHMLPFLT